MKYKSFNIQYLTLGILFLLQMLNFELLAQNCSVNAGANTTICYGDPIKLQGNIGGVYNAASVVWTLVSQPAGANAVISNPNSLNTTAGIGTVSGSYVFALTATCADNITSTDNVAITVAPQLTEPVQSGTSSFSCYTGGAVTLIGSTPAAGETVQWTASGLGGVFSNVTSSTTNFTPIFPVEECSNTYRVDITYIIQNNTTGCRREVSRTYSFSRNYGLSASADPTPTCGNSTFLKGSCPGSGISAWTLVSKPVGAADPTISSPSSRNTSVTGLVPGNYVFRYTVTGGCSPGQVNVAVSVAGGSGVTEANAGKDQYLCSIPNSVSVSGNTPAVDHTVTWTKLSGGTNVSFSNANSPSTTISGLTNQGAPYAFLYTVTNPTGCGDKDTVFIYKIPELTLRNDVQSACNAAPFDGTYNSTTQKVWLGNFAYNQLDSVKIHVTYVSGPTNSATASFGGGSSFSTLPSIAINQNVTLGSTITRSLWNTDNTIPGNELYLVRGTDPQSNTYYLQTGFTVTAVGTYRFTVSFETKCSTYVANVIVYRGYGATSVNAGTDIMVNCGATTATLAGNLTGNFGSWENVSRPAGSTNPINPSNFNLQNPVLTGLVNGTYVFRYLNNAGTTCTQTSDEVTLVVANTPPVTPSAGADATVCAGTVTLNGSAIPAGALASWTVVSPANAGLSLSGANTSTPIISGLQPNTTYTFRYTLANGCGTASDDVVITTTAFTGPQQPTISSTINCGWFENQGALPRTHTLTVTRPALVGSQVGTFSVISSPAGAVTSWSQNNLSATQTNINVTINTEAAVSIVYCVSDPNCATQTYCDTISFMSFNNVLTNIAGSDQNLCSVTSYPTSTTLSGRFSTIPGVWSFVYSSNGLIPTIANPNNSTTSVSLPADGVYRFRYQYVGLEAGCTPGGVTADIVEITTSTPGSLAIAGNDTTVCNSTGTFNLNATPLTNGSGKWTIEQVIQGNMPVIASPTSSTSAITFNGAGSVVLRLSSFGSNPNCGASSYDLVTLTYIAPAKAGEDQTFCQATSTTLTATNPAPATGTWSQISGPATAIIASPTATNTVVSGLSAAGTYAFVWTVSSAGACITRDTVLVTRYLNPTGVYAGPNVTLVCDDGQSYLTSRRTRLAYLNASPVQPGQTGTWSVQSTPQGAGTVTISDVNDPNATAGPLTAYGYYVFKWTVSNGNCSVEDFVTFYYPPQGYSGEDTTLSICVSDITLINLVSLLPGADAGGNWVRLTGAGGSFNSSTGQFTPAASVEVSDFAYIVSGTSPCSPDTAIVRISILSCLIQITGTVFYDVNGNTVINAGENGTTAGTNLYVYLVNSSGDCHQAEWFNLDT